MSTSPVGFTVLGNQYVGMLEDLLGERDALQSLLPDNQSADASIEDVLVVPSSNSRGYHAEVEPGQHTHDGPSDAEFIVEHRFQGFSGGHSHPTGTFNNGLKPSHHFRPGEVYHYTVGPAAGEVYSTVLFPGWGGFKLVSRVSLERGMGGLEHIGSSPDFVLIGSKGAHPSNHWGKPTTNAKLRAIAAEYRAETGSRLYFNDMSLHWGGIMDIGATWTPPHNEHRNGDVIDIAATPQTLPHEPVFLRIVRRYTTNYLLEGVGSSRHYHVRF